MYIGSTGISGLHHLVYEVVDNAVDEAMAGHATRIDVTLLADGGCRVDRQRPRHPGRPAPREPEEVGGRDRAHDPARRRQVRRRGLQDLRRPPRRRRLGRERAVDAGSSSRSTATAASGRWRSRTAASPTGRHRAQRPTPKQHRHDRHVLARPARSSRRPSSAPRRCIERLREMAFLNKGLEIRFKRRAHRPGHRADLPVQGRHRRLREAPQRVEGADLQARRVVRGDARRRPRSRSRCSGTPATTRASTRSRTTSPRPRAGCTRRASRRPSPTRSTSTAAPRGFLKEKDDNLLGEDIREGLTAIISVKLRNPQFEGQTKTKLGNTEMRSMVEKVDEREARRLARGAPDRGQADHDEGDRRRRGRASRPSQARDLTRRKSAARGRRPCRASSPTARRATRPSPSCSSSRATSAGSSAKDARDPHIQAILPIRGKILNVERARMDKMLKNVEIQALITAIGAGHRRGVRRRQGALPQDHHPGRRRRRRLAHPHAAAHVLLPPDAAAVRAGLHLHRAAAAVLRGARQDEDVPEGRSRARRAFVAENEGRKPEIARFKGLGEMDFAGALGDDDGPDARARCCRCRSSRRAIADEMCSILMGDDVESRRGFIQQNAKDVRFLDI